MSKLGIRVIPSKIVCALLEDQNLYIFCYKVPTVFTFKKKQKGQEVTKYHTDKVIAYFTEIVLNLIKQYNVKELMVKKAEASSFNKGKGVSDQSRQHLYIEGALLSLGSVVDITCKGCFCQQAACVDRSYFDSGLSAVVEAYQLNCDDVEHYQQDTHAGDAAFAAILLGSM